MNLAEDCNCFININSMNDNSECLRRNNAGNESIGHLTDCQESFIFFNIKMLLPHGYLMYM